MKKKGHAFLYKGIKLEWVRLIFQQMCFALSKTITPSAFHPFWAEGPEFFSTLWKETKKNTLPGRLWSMQQVLASWKLGSHLRDFWPPPCSGYRNRGGVPRLDPLPPLGPRKITRPKPKVTKKKHWNFPFGASGYEKRPKNRARWVVRTPP